MRKNKKSLIIASLISGLMISMGAGSMVYAASPHADVKGEDTEKSSEFGDLDVNGGARNNDKGEVDINPQMNASGKLKDVYDIDVDWGDMQFKFDRNKMKWDSEHHKYIALSTSNADSPWVLANLNGTKNKITITNNSNCKVKADFSFAYSSTNKFNQGVDDNGKKNPEVIGVFFKDNAAAVAAAKDFRKEVNRDTNKTLSIEIDNADGSAEERLDKNHAPQSADVFFAFSGVPDSYWIRKYTTTDSSMGTITIKFTGNPSGHATTPYVAPTP